MKKFIIYSILLIAINSLKAQKTSSVEIDASKILWDIKPYMYGLFFEDINFGADGGIYAELVKNRSFEFSNLNEDCNAALMGWSIEKPAGSDGEIQVYNRPATESENKRYIRLTNLSEGYYGLQNEGFRKMGIKAGNDYYFYIMARIIDKSNPVLAIQLTGPGNTIIGESTITGITSEWKEYKTTIKATGTTDEGQLRVLLKDKSVIEMDMISLFPSDTWKGREKGLRADLVQMLADIHPGSLRFPGGCIVEGTTVPNRYQWKKTIDDISERPTTVNRWNYTFKKSGRGAKDYFQTFGLGFYEYFLLAEDIGAEPVPILNCGMACQYQSKELVPLEDIQPFIQDVLDLIEFANGDASTGWGKKRSEMGHPEPFNLKFVGIGNEQWGPQYIERYILFEKALKKSYPDIKIISTAGPAPEGKSFKYLWNELKKLSPDLIDEHFYRSPGWFLSNAKRYDDYDRNGPKVYAGEYAAHTKYYNDAPTSYNNWDAALAEAAFMTGMERNADVVNMTAYAPLFGNVNAWQWRPDLIWFDNLSVMPTPNYYVQKMYSNNKGTHVVAMSEDKLPLTGQNNLFGSSVIDKDKKQLIVKLVNSSEKDIKKTINIKGCKLAKSGKITLLTAKSTTSYNVLSKKDNLAPVTKELSVSSNRLKIVIPAKTFVLINLNYK